MRTELLPDSENDAELVRNCHPPDWRNPAPASRYNLVVIGGGTAGLVAAGGASLIGARVALVERDLTGGDCLVTGCVPSKAVLRSARAAFDVRDAGRFGVRVGGETFVDFSAAMERMRGARANISAHDAVRRFCDEFKVDVFLGIARFAGPDSVDVDGTRLRFRRAIVATGSAPAIPDLPGLREAGFVTNETIFNLIALPRRLAIIGGGPVGCEMAQAFVRLGALVTLLARDERLLPHDEPEAAALILNILRREGIDVRLSTSVLRIGHGADAKRLHLNGGATIDADEILVAAGRRARVDGLNLQAAGVRCDGHGVTVDDFLRTSNPRIYAAGDVCLPARFTHTADASARVAMQNALLPAPLGRKRWSRAVIPWCTYTDPEVAHVGMTEPEARSRGVRFETIRVPMDDVDRAVTDGETEGFLKLLIRAGGDRILGATLVSRHAGESISEVTTAMVGKIGLKKLSNVIHPYPTQAEAIKEAADEHFQRTLSRGAVGVLRKWFGWVR